jgi:phosphopantetheine binding protein
VFIVYDVGAASPALRWSAEANLTTYYFADAPHTAASGTTAGGAPAPGDHRHYLEAHATLLADSCRALTRDASPTAVLARQRTTALIGRIGGELLGMAVVLARAGTPGSAGDTAVADLAEAACAAARRRLDGLWPELAAELAAGADVGADARVGDRWLADAAPAFLTGDVPTGPAGTAPAQAHAEIEAAVTAVWRDLFGIADVDRDDDFYALGGHSMTAVRMSSRLHADLGLRVPVRMILENPTVADLTRCLVRAAP